MNVDSSLLLFPAFSHTWPDFIFNVLMWQMTIGVFSCYLNLGFLGRVKLVLLYYLCIILCYFLTDFFFLSKCVHVYFCELKSTEIPFSALCLQVQYKSEARLIQ